MWLGMPASLGICAYDADGDKGDSDALAAWATAERCAGGDIMAYSPTDARATAALPFSS